MAQPPPLEARLARDYDNVAFSWGGLLRLVARQKRYDIGSGSIVSNGQDIGRTSGFAVFSLNAGWRPRKDVLVGLGVIAHMQNICLVLALRCPVSLSRTILGETSLAGQYG